MVDWQLATRVGSARQERSEMDVERDGQVAGGTGSVSKDLRILMEESGREILRFFRTPLEFKYVRYRSSNTPDACLQVDDELVARHRRSALAPLEKRPSSLSLPSPLGETTPRYTVKERRFGFETVKDWGVIPRAAKDLSLGSMVRALRTDHTYHWDLLHLLAVIDALPRLEELYVEPHKFTGRRWELDPRSHFFTQEQENQLTGSIDGLATGTLPPPPRTQGVVLTETRVRVLMVFGAAVTVPAIEAVVCRCPLVEVLKLSQTVDHYRYEGTIEEMKDVQTSTRELGDTAPPQPRTSSLPHHHHHPSILCHTSRELSLMQDYIKTFKANWLTGLWFDRIRKTTSLPFQNALHTILCACPNLVAFTALMKDGGLPKVAELTRGAVIRSTAHEEGERSNLPPSQRHVVWACRNLTTLHISIAKEDNRDCTRHESSLVIFEYLSLACPRLDELSIRSKWIS
ncbi:hypothetical protein EC957_002922 [Mortierella hygrophila]|uniref:Uncharacterized protein n=1 Tax=Mortierella hygrophila TaxID=979708 RepID=A0A9P6F3P2_9FUNG|nr:hypothetical protein EC957_002922 [Mortierella hygrophila]